MDDGSGVYIGTDAMGQSRLGQHPAIKGALNLGHIHVAGKGADEAFTGILQQCGIHLALRHAPELLLRLPGAAIIANPGVKAGAVTVGV